MCTPSGRATGLSVGQLLEAGLAQALVAGDRVGGAGGLALLVDVGGLDRARSGVPKRSSAQAVAAFCCERKPKASVSSREMPHLSAMRSAPSNCEVISYCGKYDFGIGMPRPRSLRPLEPIGTRLITSTPPARAESTAPLPTRAVARLVACCDEPHWVSTVVLATDEREPGAEPRGAADVEGLLADLAHAAGDDLADRGGIDARPLDGRLLHGGEQVGGVDGGQPAVALPDGGADGFDDHDIRHAGNLPARSAPATTGGFEHQQQGGGADEGHEHRAEVELVEGVELLAGGELGRRRRRGGRRGCRWRSWPGSRAWVPRRPGGPARRRAAP